jgi:plasmid stabilization system protein ParE
MALKLRFDPQTITDLRDIRAYLLAKTDTGTAERVRAHLRLRMEKLRHNPRLGVRTSEPDIRVLPPTRYPCIYYTITADAVVILHVRHSARRDPDFSNLAG